MLLSSTATVNTTSSINRSTPETIVHTMRDHTGPTQQSNVACTRRRNMYVTFAIIRNVNKTAAGVQDFRKQNGSVLSAAEQRTFHGWLLYT